MSPEHYFDFKRADKRADIYSLGKILFEAVEGKIKLSAIPFQCVELAKTDSPFLEQLNLIIRNATAENREERILSVQDLREQLEQAVMVFKNQKLSATPEMRKSIPLLYRPKWLWTGIVVATLSVLLVTIWHFMGEPGWDLSKGGFSKDSSVHDSLTKSDNAKAPAKLDTAASSTASEFVGKQHLISGGNLIISASTTGNKKQTVYVKPFSVDEFLVTNQQFVDFLNHNLSRIGFEKGVVKGDGANWFLLGEVHASYEPIVYQNGKFHISNPAHAAYPVMRVTGYGAVAFSRFVGRRLPTENELLYVLIKGASQLNTKESLDNWRDESSSDWKDEFLPRDKITSTKAESQTSEGEFSAALFIPNTLGIRGLNAETGEWVVKSSADSSEDQTKINQYAVLGGLEGTRSNSPLPESVARFPWEGFEEIGFRTAKTAADSESSR